MNKLAKCIRCKSEFKYIHPLDCVCINCLESEPKLTSEEKTQMNYWDDIDVLFEVIKLSRKHKWSWVKNWNCKYLNIRVDMRDGGCIITDREGQRIGPDALKWQYSEESKERPKT